MNALIVLAVALQADGESADLSFLAYLDIWIIGGLVMLAVVVVVGKWLYGKAPAAGPMMTTGTTTRGTTATIMNADPFPRC